MLPSNGTHEVVITTQEVLCTGQKISTYEVVNTTKGALFVHSKLLGTVVSSGTSSIVSTANRADLRIDAMHSGLLSVVILAFAESRQKPLPL